MPATTATTRLTWSPDAGMHCATHVEWVRLVDVLEPIVQAHVAGAYGDALTVTLRTPGGGAERFGIWGVSSLSGSWERLADSYDLPIPKLATDRSRAWERLARHPDATSLRALLDRCLLQATMEIDELRGQRAQVGLSASDYTALLDAVRLAERHTVAAQLAPARAVLARVAAEFEVVRRRSPVRCRVCGSGNIHETAWVSSRTHAHTGDVAPVDELWCDRCGEHTLPL